MRAHQQSQQPAVLPQVLQLGSGGRCWRWVLLHASLDTLRQERRRRRRAPAGHTHEDAYHILLYSRGDTEVLLEGRPRPVRAGTLVLSPPGDCHDFGPVRAGVISYSQVTFAFKDAAGRPLALPFRELLGAWSGLELPEIGVVVQLEAARREGLLALLTRLVDAAGSREALSDVLVRLAAGEIFAFLVREVYLAASGVGGAGPASDALAAARAHVEAHYRERVTVATLARLALLSPGYFLRAFRRRYGLSPIAYQGRLRVEAARSMLRFTDLSCKEIAHRLGYGDSYHFSKSFRKAAGLAPTEYRRRHRRV
jgi:AraC-like DNA-binding protein